MEVIIYNALCFRAKLLFGERKNQTDLEQLVKKRRLSLKGGVLSLANRAETLQQDR